MPLTLTVPPKIVMGARSYAEHSGMTLEALMLRYLESIAEAEQKHREQEAREMYDYFMSQKGSFVEGYAFNREEANAR